ncbi:MAG: glycosyltransferase [Bacteroidetes bacterium]|nr:glycosyltransferase [Bacteroidota bacterium]
MKVLHLPYNVASLISNSILALKSIGVEAKGIAFGKNERLTENGITVFDDFKGDNAISKKIKQASYLLHYYKLIKWADIVHWYWKVDILPMNLEFKLLKLFKKPGVVEWLGNDIRIPEEEFKDNPYYKSEWEHSIQKSSLERAKKIQKVFSRYGFKVVSIQGMDRYLLPEYYPVVAFYLRQRIVSDDFVPAFPDPCKKVPVIVHASAVKKTKGTEYVRIALNRLKLKYEFEEVMLDKVPRTEALKQMQRADIYVDQLILGHHGLAAVEAMAFGKPVLCYTKQSLLSQYPSELPLVNANPDDVYEQLKFLLDNPAKRTEIGIKSRQYVEMYHSQSVLAHEMVNIYKRVIEDYKNKA